jgi:hypothetical protein
VTVAYVCCLPLTCLAPEIVGAIGRQPKWLKLAEMVKKCAGWLE